MWQYDAGKQIAAPSGYRFTSAEDVPARDPQAWKLEGSLDGQHWTPLDEHTDEPVFENRHQTRAYTIAQPTACRFFRFTFVPNPGETHFQVSEISIDGVTPTAAAGQDYSRILDLRTAAAKITYKKDGRTFTREHFVSAPDEVFVSRLTGPVSFTVSLDRPERFETTAVNNHELLMTGTLNDGRGGKGVTYAGRLRVVARGGSVKAEGNKLVVAAADEVILLFAAATDYRGFAGRQLSDPVAATTRDLDKAATKSFDELRAAQKADHEKWFHRVELSLPVTANSALPTDQRLAGFAKEGGGSRLGGALLQLWPVSVDQFVAAGGLAGQFTGHLGRGNSDAMERRLAPRHQCADELLAGTGLQSVGVAGAVEQAHRVAGRARDARRRRRTTTRAAGWRTSSRTRGASPRRASSASWGATTSGSAWLCQHLWEQYAFTLDRDYLRWAYPILKGCAEFYLDNLWEEPENKWLVTGPSNSPENSFRLPDGRHAEVCMGPTIDMQLLRELFGNTARAAELLGVDDELRRELKDKRARLAPNQIGPDGRLQEWLKPYRGTRAAHRHTLASVRAASVSTKSPGAARPSWRRPAASSSTRAATTATAGRWPGG